MQINTIKPVGIRQFVRFVDNLRQAKTQPYLTELLAAAQTQNDPYTSMLFPEFCLACYNDGLPMPNPAATRLPRLPATPTGEPLLSATRNKYHATAIQTLIEARLAKTVPQHVIAYLSQGYAETLRATLIEPDDLLRAPDQLPAELVASLMRTFDDYYEANEENNA